VRALFEAQAKVMGALAARHQALEDDLAKNRRNSSKPPSSAGLKQPKPKSGRQKSGKPSGGPKGHGGHGLEPVEKPQHTEAHLVSGAFSGRGNTPGGQAAGSLVA
jgi:transposase